MQQLTIAGTITQAAEVRRTSGGKDVLSFSVAVSNGKDDQGNWRDSTFFDCSIWGKRATDNVARILSKGTKVTVTGRPSAREHNGKAYLQCMVNDFTLQGGGEQRQERQQDSGYGAGGYGGGYGSNIDDDEIPFAPEWRA